VEFKDKICVVTGAASGIGAASARAFAAEGARVIAVDINEEGAKQTASDCGGNSFSCDVGSEESVNQLVEDCERAVGPIDLFFANAGILTGGDPLTTPIDVWENQWQVNVMSHIFAIRAVLPGMLERGSGYFVHTASMAGILTTHGNLTYATTKHAVVGIAEWMSVTYHDQGVKFSLLAPLGVRTPMLGDTNRAWASSAAGPIKEPEEVAQQVVDAVRKEEFLILTDEIAQTWMNRKTEDLNRWLKGMRRLQGKLGGAPK
jgi:NAD(P)-dependent dehydrogenase (short-subunit alcohol dehydrogenase family)